MASRVNTKFVVILIVAVVAMLGLLFAAYSVVYKTADDLAAKGDQAMAAAEYDQARLLYSKAVNKDPTIIANIEKWIDALEHWVPETETAYYDAFRTDYLGAIARASIVQRTNVEAYHRELGMRFDMMSGRYNRNTADSIVARTTEALGNFDGVSGVDPLWPTLRRYRGMTWQRIGSEGGVVDEKQFDLVLEDLNAALEADPSDDQAMASKMRWMVFVAIQKIANDDKSNVLQARLDAVELGNAHLRTHPNSPLVRVSLIALEMELKRSAAVDGLIDTEKTQAALDSLSGFVDQIESTYRWLKGLPAEKLSIEVLRNFQLVEQLADSDSRFSRSIELYEKMAEAYDESPEVLLTLAGMYATVQNQDRASEVYDRIIGLSIPPISAAGVSLFDAQRNALISLSRIQLDEYDRLSVDENTTPEQLKEVLANAVRSRDKFASRVTEDDTSLLIIDGRIELANENPEEALRLFTQYNSETQNQSNSGLWLEARAARELNQLGTARSALQRLVAIQRHHIWALIELADIEIRLQDLHAARAYYEQVLLYDPNNRTARGGITNINALLDPSLIEDPAVSLVLTARQLRRGTDGNPGDISAAISVLKEGIASVNYDPSVTRELASMLMDRGDISGARGILDLAVNAHPDNEDLITMKEALLNDDEVEILISMILANQPDRLEQLISIANIGFARQRYEMLDSTIAELMEIAPNEPRALDLAFVRALSLDDIDRAKELAQRASDLNTDRVNGLSYQSRVASIQGDHTRAVLLLEQATTSGSADSSLYRMLALEQYAIGRTEASIASFEQALSIRPDDQSSITEYINMLIQSRRYDDALDTARRFQRHAIDNPVFMSMWLSLEAGYGGSEGQEFAVRQREKFFELDPTNTQNTYALANLYIETGRWNESRVLIDQLRAADDSLVNAQLEAKWFANQGRVGNQNGLAMAQQVYLDYIEDNKEEIDSTPYIALAQFMLERGYPNLAVQAAMNAVEREDPEVLGGTKLLGELFMMLNQYTNAAEAFQKILDAGVDDNDQYRLRMVDMLIRTRQFEQARDHFDRLAQPNKETTIAMLQNSEIEEGLGNKKTASDLLDLAVATYPDDALVYIKRAEFLSGSEETLADMLADVDAALQINPNDWRAYRVRAAGYFAIEQREDALRDLMRAVRLNPSLDQALFGIVNELMIDGRNSEAYEFAVEIVEKRQRDASLIDSLGSLFSSREDWERAAQFYQLGWEVQRSPRAGATLIDAIVRTRNPDTALANSVINDLTTIAGDINSSPGLLAAQALVLQARGRDQLALQQLTKAFDLSTNDDSQLIQWSGNISRYYEDQPMQDQISYIETLKRRNPNQEVLNWLDLFIAQRLLRVGSKTDTALSVFERLLKADNQKEVQRIAHQSLGTSLYTKGDYAGAADIWSAGAELFPDDWEMSNNLAYVLSAELGEHERALKLAENAVAANPDRSEPYDTIGTIYTALGKYDQAKEMLNTGMKYAQSVRSRVTLVIAQIKLDLAMGNPDEARAKLLDIRSLMRAMPTRDLGLETQVDEVEAKIDSDG